MGDSFDKKMALLMLEKNREKERLSGSSSKPSDSPSRRERELLEELEKLRAEARETREEKESKEVTLDRLKREKEELLRKLDSKKASDSRSKDTLTDLEREKKRLELELASSTYSSKKPSESEMRVRELEADFERMKKLMSSSSSASTTKAPSESQMRIEELKKKKADLAMKLSSSKSSTEMLTERRRLESSVQKKVMGVEICFLVDCTGSMEGWIREACNKIKDIMEAATRIDARAIPRVAFIGYRDYCARGDNCSCRDCSTRVEVFPFEEIETADRLKAHISGVKAFGGGDGPESICDALLEATKLEWITSTRLIIHIGDAPCHGDKYHTPGGDSHSRGDPKGLEPEDLLRKLCNLQISYYFGRINAYTDIMTDIFRGVYESSGKQFTVLQLGSDVSMFLPKVVASIKDSMSRSASFAKRH